MRTTRAYLRKRGRPVAYYVDKDSIYNVNRKTTVEEELSDKEPITQFTRAMGELGIEVILAHSPQAKGRVERGFETHQDRLVKELRLAGISTMEDANKFLREVYIPKHNRRYAVEPAEPVDVHKPLLRSHNLNAILSIQVDRQIHNDFTVRFDSRFFQLAPGQALRPRTKVVVQQRLDGTLRITYKRRYLQFEQVSGRPYRPEQQRRAKPEDIVIRPTPPPRLPNPIYAAFHVGSDEPTNPPASAALS